MREKPEKLDSQHHSGEDESERSRREMVYLLRSILEEVHQQRGSLQPGTLQQNSLQAPPLVGSALDAARLFFRIEGLIALANPGGYV